MYVWVAAAKPPRYFWRIDNTVVLPPVIMDVHAKGTLRRIPDDSLGR
jgi:hypothetical protein